MEVITANSGVMIFVLSSLPPSPASITAMSTLWRANHQKARPVVISKKESPRKSGSPAASHRYVWKNSQTSSLEGMAQPPAVTTFILSRKSTRCGEV